MSSAVWSLPAASFIAPVLGSDQTATRQRGCLCPLNRGNLSLHGLEIIKQLGEAEPNVRMLVLTGQADPKLPGQLIRLGVAGFVDKTAPLSYVLQAIDTVMAGGMFFAANITADPGVTPAEELPHASEVSPTILTQREVEVSRLVARGRSSKEIASDLNLSTRTVEKHRANIMDKIQVREVASLVRWCMQNGLG